jgi:hypothetical protein
MAAGTALVAALTGAGGELPDLLVSGALAGLAVGAAQSALLARDRLAWTAVTAAGWTLGWLASWAVVGDDRGFYVFGGSGAVLATVLTGVALRRILAQRPVVA